MTNLTGLRLTGTEVTDLGMNNLATLTKLTELDLGGTSVGQEGILRLKPLVGLRELTVHPRAFRGLNLDELKRAMPGLHVSQ